MYTFPFPIEEAGCSSILAMSISCTQILVFRCCSAKRNRLCGEMANLRAEKNKMSLDILTVPESKEVLKEWWIHVTEASLKGRIWDNLIIKINNDSTSHVLLNDGDTFWEMCSSAISSLYKHCRVHWHNLDGIAYYGQPDRFAYIGITKVSKITGL